MDPNATLRILSQLAKLDDAQEEIEELVEALFEWSEKGGFDPDWEKYPAGTQLYREKLEELTYA